MSNVTNLILLEALGIEADNVLSVDICMRPGAFPLVTIQRHIASKRKLKTVTDRLELRPKSEPEKRLYARVVFTGDAFLVIEFKDLVDTLPNEDYVRVEHVAMTEQEFEALPEFEGY